MAVESRFVVIRQGVEVETFMDKKAADEYDKMLDMADNLSDVFAHAPIELSENIREELSIYLAQNRDNVLIALQAKKVKAPTAKATTPAKKVATPVEVNVTDSVDNSADESADESAAQSGDINENDVKKVASKTPKATSKKATAKDKTAAA